MIPFLHNNEELKNACKNNLTDCVLNNKILFNWNFGLYGACLSNNFILIDKMIELGANDFNWALRGISQNGNKQAIKKIEKLLNEHNHIKPNFEWALAGACLGENLEGISYLIKKEITNINSAFRITCEQGNLQIFKILFNEKKESLDTTVGLAGACYGFRNIKNYPMSIIELLCDNLKGDNIETALYEVSYCGFEDIIHKIKNIFGITDVTQIVRGLTLGNHINLLQKYLTLETIKIGYYEAAYSGNVEMIKWYEKKFELNKNIYYLTGKCQSENINLELLNEPILCNWCQKIHK